MKPSMPEIRIKRVYEAAAPADGVRLLAERLWPRGVRKAALRLDAWVQASAPSSALRRWFGHDPAKWREFPRRYRAELDANPVAWREILQSAERHPVTLLFSSRDAEHNNVVVLRDYLEEKRRGRRPWHERN